LIDELPFKKKREITALIIQLSGPDVALEVTVKHGEETCYSRAKELFRNVANACLEHHTKANAGSRLNMKFTMEAVREGGFEEEGEDDDVVILF
jgi:hypothetical protein